MASISDPDKFSKILEFLNTDTICYYFIVLTFLFVFNEINISNDRCQVSLM